MSTLRNTVLTEEQTPQVLRDCEQLLEQEVRSKKGISGGLVKMGYKTVKAFKPGFLKSVLADLVPEFCDALEPLHEEYTNDPQGTFGALLRQHGRRATGLMLSVTDGKASQSTNRTIKKVYSKLRPAAERHVMDAIPGLSRLLDTYYPSDS